MKAIYKKLHEIMQGVDYIKKDKTNEFHKYNYASERIIKEKLHEQLVDKEVLFNLSVDNQRIEDGKTLIDCIYKFIDIETGETLEGKFCGQGEDKGDKGLYKAITGAIKYCLTSTFLIPTGDDPEGDTETDRKANRSPADKIKACESLDELKRLWALMSSNDKKIYASMKEAKKTELEKQEVV